MCEASQATLGIEWFNNREEIFSSLHKVVDWYFGRLILSFSLVKRVASNKKVDQIRFQVSLLVFKNSIAFLWAIIMTIYTKILVLIWI